MGEMADWHLEQAAFDDAYDDSPNTDPARDCTVARRGKWTTKEGTRLWPREMTDAHLAHVVAYLTRRKDGTLATAIWLSRFHREQRRRQEMEPP